MAAEPPTVVGATDATCDPGSGAGCIEHAASASSDMLARARALICIASLNFCRAHDDGTHGQIYLDAVMGRLPDPGRLGGCPSE